MIGPSKSQIELIKKLTGRDFIEGETLNVHDQVDFLIKQATDEENLCQGYIGWSPFW